MRRSAARIAAAIFGAGGAAHTQTSPSGIARSPNGSAVAIAVAGDESRDASPSSV